jgi:mono/diheme cytochrome c family protein
VNADFLRTRRLARLVLLAALPLGMGACEWFTDFKRQPNIYPWEPATMDSLRRDSVPPRGNPQGSVPIRGGSPPSFIVSYANLPNTVDSMSTMPNPTPVSDASLANGHRYYQINCAVCHGDSGDGAGGATQFGFPPISILTPAAVARTDGYIYGIIRNGRGLMPNYNRIEHMDRWDVVNYVRGLQGQLGRQMEMGPLGVPGEGGAAVPGATMTGPNRPSPHLMPQVTPQPFPGSPRTAAERGTGWPETPPRSPGVGGTTGGHQ